MIFNEYIESNMTSEKFINERFDSYLKIKVSGNNKRFVGKFTLPGEARQDGEVEDIVYTVTIFGPDKRGVNIDDGIHPADVVQANVWCVVFSNSISGMYRSGAGNGPVIFSTVVKVIDEFVKYYKPMALHFTPFHEGLIRPYHILSMEAERKLSPKYIYVNKKSAMKDKIYFMLSEKYYEIWLNAKNYQ